MRSFTLFAAMVAPRTIWFGAGTGNVSTGSVVPPATRAPNVPEAAASITVTGVEAALLAIDGWVVDGLVPAAAAVVVDAEGVLAERYAGVRERRGDEPVGPATLFALASLTKPLVAAACMVAVEEGLLDLDAEVRDAFSLRHLLSHCAGLPEPGRLWEEPPGYPPGTQRWYSNAGYVQAARLLEAASGMRCADYLAEAVLSPLAMDASLGLAPADDARAARVWQPGRYGDGELFNSEQFRRDGPPQGGGFAPRAPMAPSSRACSRAGRRRPCAAGKRDGR